MSVGTSHNDDPGHAMNACRRLFLALSLIFGVAAAPASAVELAVSCGAVGQELELCREGAESWASKTGNSVKVISTPASATERLALYQQLLAAESTDVDVMQIDIIWPGMLGPQLLDLAPHVHSDVLEAQLPEAVAAAEVGGRLVALPWFVDVGLLYYRRDLLEMYGAPVPETWDALAAAALLIQEGERAAGNDRMWGWVWQGRAYEGLTCNALEWIASSGGGTIVDAEGAVTVDNGNAVAALDAAASWVGRITPKGVLNYQEEEARALFQSGNAVFMRNWPYAWALANGEGSPVAGRVGVAPLPHGGDGRSVGTLGGQMLAVSRFSRNPEAAVDLVLFLTGRAEQRRRAIGGAYNPSFVSLYDDPDVLAANPFLADIRDLLAGAVARPAAVTGRRYSQVSNAFWSAAHATLSGSGTGAENLDDLAVRLKRLSRGGRW